MLTRIIITFIFSLTFHSISAQTDSILMKWAIDVELGYGTVLGSNGKPPPVLCFEGCTPLSSRGDFKSRRIGLLVDWNNKNAITLSGSIVDFEFDRLYRDDFQGNTFGEDWDIRYLATGVSYLKTILSNKRWTGRVEVGASYLIQIKKSDRLTARPKNTLNLSIGGRIGYDLKKGKALFARIMVAHSLRNNLEYAADTASLNIDKFAPFYATLGFQFDLQSPDLNQEN